MSASHIDVQESELRLFPGLDEEVADTLRAMKAAAADSRPRMVDTTMLFAPRSGGVKRYLLSKKAWLEANRPGVAHNLVVPGAGYRAEPDGVIPLLLPAGGGPQCEDAAESQNGGDSFLHFSIQSSNRFLMP